MLTLQELQAAPINVEVAREAHAQAEKRLEDALNTKSSHEQKAFAVLAAYVTLALALFTVFGVMSSSTGYYAIAPAFVVTGGVYAVGGLLAAIALLPQSYGALGSDPSAWLRPGVIDGDGNALAFALTYETFFHKARIDASTTANQRKALFVRLAIIAGLAAPLVLVGWLMA